MIAINIIDYLADSLEVPEISSSVSEITVTTDFGIKVNNYCEIISFDFRFTLTRLWMNEMQTFKEYVEDLKDAIEEIRKTIRR